MRYPTPRNLRQSRGIGTLIGNGWLRESPRTPAWPNAAKWEGRGKSLLRKCLFMEVPDEVRKMMPAVSPAAMPPPPQRPPLAAADVIPHRRNPNKDARE